MKVSIILLIYNSGMRLIVEISKSFCAKLKSNHIQIIPQQFTIQPLQQYYHLTSKNYDFLLNSNPNCSQIYVHHSDTPSSLLKKNAIHIFPDSVPALTLQQKYKAYIKRLYEQYNKAYDNCKNPAEVFHLERRIKTDIRQRTKYIGRISGKYKHYNLFKSVNDLNREKTQQQYKKNGISVTVLGKNKIYPQGPVWLPTTDTYLKLLQQSLTKIGKQEIPHNILDLGCGSGILSFILAKQFKSSKVFAVDNNKFAVDTCSTNSASLGIQNITAFEADITKQDFQLKAKQSKAPSHFNLIISNPPWIIAKRNAYESQILDGVYDNKGKFLQSTFKIASKMLKDKKSKFILIYSDLSEHLGLTIKTIDQLCKQNNLLITSKAEADYPKAIQKQSPLAPYKLKSKVQLYQITKSV